MLLSIDGDVDLPGIQGLDREACAQFFQKASRVDENMALTRRKVLVHLRDALHAIGRTLQRPSDLGWCVTRLQGKRCRQPCKVVLEAMGELLEQKLPLLLPRLRAVSRPGLGLPSCFGSGTRLLGDCTGRRNLELTVQSRSTTEQIKTLTAMKRLTPTVSSRSGSASDPTGSTNTKPMAAARAVVSSPALRPSIRAETTTAG
jgi:hypothetical protein